MADPQRRRDLTPTGRAAMVGAAVLAIAFMMGDSGTRNDANNRGPSGIPDNRAPGTTKVPSPKETPSKQQ